VRSLCTLLKADPVEPLAALEAGWQA